MKSLISALALLLMTAPAFADVSVEIKSVSVNELQPNGKTWDLKIPKTTKHLPELMVEVVMDSKSVLSTPVQTDAVSAEFAGQTFNITKGGSAIIKVWDVDAGVGKFKAKELMAEIPFTLAAQSGEVELKGGSVTSLKLMISGNEAAPAAEAPAAEAPAAEAPAAEAPAAEAPAAEAPAAEAPAAEAPAAEAPAAEAPAAE